MEQMNTFGVRTRYAQMTPEECLDAFKPVVAHPHLMTVDYALHEALREAGGSLLIFLCGPPGVGKTAMKDHVICMERVPILSLLARPPLSGTFDWKEFLQSGILALEPSWIDRKIALDTGDVEESMHTSHTDLSGAGHRPLKRVKGYDLRVSLDTAIKRRRPAAVIIDDAQHLFKVNSGRQLQNQLDCIKSLANVTETVYVKYNPDSSKRSVTVAKAFCGRLKKAVLFIILVLEEGTYARDPLGMVPTRCTS